MKLKMIVPHWVVTFNLNSSAPGPAHYPTMPYGELGPEEWYGLYNRDAFDALPVLHRGEIPVYDLPHTAHDRDQPDVAEAIPVSVIDFVKANPNVAGFIDVYKFTLPADAFVGMLFHQVPFVGASCKNVITHDWQHDKGIARLLHLNTEIPPNYNVARDYQRTYHYDESLLHSKGEIWVVDQWGSFSTAQQNVDSLQKLNNVQLAIFTNN